MSLSFSVLASGSKGNCTLVAGGGSALLIDCGLSAKAISARLASVGFALSDLSGVVLTHGHGDHVAGAAVLARKGLSLYGTPPTLARLPGSPPQSQLKVIAREGRFRLGRLTVTTVPTLHDAPGSCAVVVSYQDVRLGLVTDLGMVTKSLEQSFRHLDGLILEMNHDEELLLSGPYPEMLKRRIRSELGHLSNAESAAFLARIHHPSLQHVTLAHLSEANNRPSLALAAARSVLGERRAPTLTIASQEEASPLLHLLPRVGAQLGLL